MLARADDVTAMPSYEAGRSRMEIKRASLMPHSLEEVNVEGSWAETWNGDDFLSKHDAINGFLIFATESNRRHLAECREVRKHLQLPRAYSIVQYPNQFF